MKKKKIILFAIGLLVGVLIYIFLGGFVRDSLQKPVKIVPATSIWQDSDIKDFHINHSTVVTWDDLLLNFYDFSGNEIKDIGSNGYDTNIYFSEDEVYFLDKQLNTLFLYNSFGELQDKISVTGNIFNVKKIGRDFYLHKKETKSSVPVESIVKLSRDGKEEQIYETVNYILNFDIDGSKLLVADISTGNYGYKTTIKIVDGSREYPFELNNEVAIKLKIVDGKGIVLTNKKLYSLNGDKKNEVELMLIKDGYIGDKEIAILYNDTLAVYNSNLKLKGEYNIPINSTSVFNYDNGYFVYGPTDLCGYIGQKREFVHKFDAMISGVKGKGKILGVLYKERVELYKFETIDSEVEQ